MAVISREAVAAPAELAREVVPVEALGGDVIVTELSLDQRLDFEDAVRRVHAKPGATQHALVPHLLARAVVLDDGAPLYTLQQWQTWGARHKAASLQLFLTAMRLSGLDAGEAEKN